MYLEKLYKNLHNIAYFRVEMELCISRLITGGPVTRLAALARVVIEDLHENGLYWPKLLIQLKLEFFFMTGVTSILDCASIVASCC